MAEKGEVAVTPEMIMAAGTNSRRSSMGRTSSSNSGEKLVPHYLRASTGSCHDFCKYGRKHTFETKTRQPMPKNVARRSLDGESSVDSVVLPEGKKITSIRAKAKFSSTSKLSEVDATTFTRHELLVKSPIFPSPMQREVLNERKKKLLAEARPLHKSRSHATNALKNLKPEATSATRNSEDTVVEVFTKAKERKLPEKCDNISKPKSVKVKPLRSAGSPDNSRRKNDSKMGKSSGNSKEAVKKVAATSTASLSSNSIHRAANLTARKRGNLKTIPLKTHNKIKISQREQVRSEEVQEKTFQSEEVQKKTFQSEEVQEKTFQSEKVQEKTFQSEKVQEKTLYVIKIENEEKPQQSDQNETDGKMEAAPLPPPKSLSPPTSTSLLANEEDHDVSEIEYTESEAEDDSYSEGDELGSMEADNASSEGSKKGRSQVGMFQSKGKDPQSTKLSFRRGKIIDICSESNSPRRLKFRRGRLLVENQRAVDGLRKNFKREKEVDSDTNATGTAPETVVLRHQDVQGKKDAQGLFNNVIEETASKLVETRKSKVKALVGAFETVISLQDGKPSLDSVS